MTAPRNIAIVTVEWSDDYAGSELSGHFDGEGNEKYIFQPFRGRFYGYFPPNGHNFPVPKNTHDWLIFFVSRPGRGAPSVVVGWYENASIVGNTSRPDAGRLGLNAEGGAFTYSAVAPWAVSIPVAARDCVLPKGDSLRSFAFVRIDGVDKKSRVPLLTVLLAYRRRVVESDTGSSITANAPFPIDPILKRKVEQSAINAVKSDYRRGYTFEDMQSIRGIGYDLKFTDKKTGEVWCIEVKGTASGRDAFFITRSERGAGRDIFAEEMDGGPRRWRLALVTSALDPDRRSIEYLNSSELEDRFDFQCLQWQATSKSKAAK